MKVLAGLMALLGAGWILREFFKVDPDLLIKLNRSSVSIGSAGGTYFREWPRREHADGFYPDD